MALGKLRGYLGCFLGLLACFASGGMVSAQTPPSLQLLDRGKVVDRGKWPDWPRGGGVDDVEVLGKLGYAVLSSGGLVVFDVSDPAHPVPLGSCDTEGGAFGVVAVAGNHAYVGGEHGFEVIDVSESTRPRYVGRYQGGTASDLAVVGNHVYFLSGPRGMIVVDVRDPTHCVRVSGYRSNLAETTGGAGGLSVAGNYAYIAYGEGGLQVIDISDPAHCQLVGRCAIFGATNVAVSGSYAFVTNTAGLQVIDVSDPVRCVHLGSLDFSEEAFDVQLAGPYAFVAVGSAGFHIIDVRDPANCVRVGGLDTEHARSM